MIDWNRGAKELYDFIRALTKPYPGAYTFCKGKEYIIWAACPILTETDDLYVDKQNGQVISVLNESVLVKCGSGLLLIRQMTGQEQVREGMEFESVDFYEQMKTIVTRHKSKYNTALSDIILKTIGEEDLLCDTH